MQHTHARPRRCKTCDGFPTVAITTGPRLHDGSRATIRITCPACNGTGHSTSARTLTRAGK